MVLCILGSHHLLWTWTLYGNYRMVWRSKCINTLLRRIQVAIIWMWFCSWNLLMRRCGCDLWWEVCLLVCVDCTCSSCSRQLTNERQIGRVVRSTIYYPSAISRDVGWCAAAVGVHSCFSEVFRTLAMDNRRNHLSRKRFGRPIWCVYVYVLIRVTAKYSNFRNENSRFWNAYVCRRWTWI